MCPLCQKVKINLTKKENTLTNLWYCQLKSLKYSYCIRLNSAIFILNENYTKVTNSPKVTKGIGIEPREEEDFPFIKSNIEFIITEKDIKNGFIILETSYNIFFDSYFGFYDFYIQ